MVSSRRAPRFAHRRPPRPAPSAPRQALRALALALALVLGTVGLAPSAHAAPSASVQRMVLERAAFSRIKALLPADAAQRVAELRAKVDVIDPTQYVCGPTELDAWVAEKTASFSTIDKTLLTVTGLDAFPAFDAMLFGDPADPFYAPRLRADQVTETFAIARGFWTPAPPDVSLVGLHSDVVRDVAKVSRLGGLVFGLDSDEAAVFGHLMVAYVRFSPGLERGRHPLFSFNAFAMADPSGEAASSVVIGDGILQAYDDLGHGDVAGAFVTAHEVGHTVQVAGGVYDDYTGEPEQTRYLELMADAMAATVLAHPQGLDLRAARVEHFVAVAYAVGDCAFDSGGHHGTPNQRARAAQWAVTLSDAARPAGRVLTFAEFRRAFDAAYPNLVAPDATT